MSDFRNREHGCSHHLTCRVDPDECQIIEDGLSRCFPEKAVHIVKIPGKPILQRNSSEPPEGSEVSSGTGTSGTFTASDEIHTSAVPSRIGLLDFPVPEQSHPGGQFHSQLDQEEKPILHQIEISVLDANGYLVRTGAYTIRIDVEGGTLAGLESGSLSDDTDYTSNTRASFRGHLIAYVWVRAGETARICARSSDLGTARIEI